MKIIDEEVGEIKRMRVKIEFQRKGIGKLILEKLIDIAIQKKLKKLVLDTSSNQVPAQKLYESFGFLKVREEHFHGLLNFFYERRI